MSNTVWRLVLRQPQVDYGGMVTEFECGIVLTYEEARVWLNDQLAKIQHPSLDPVPYILEVPVGVYAEYSGPHGVFITRPPTL